MQIVIDIDEEDYNDLTLTGENTIPLSALLHLREALRNGTPVSNEDMYIPYLMHKEMDIPLLECQKAYDIAIDYLRSQGKVRG